MKAEPIDTKTEYVPPRRFWKRLWHLALGVFAAWLLFYGGQQIAVLWFQIISYALGAFLALCDVLALYGIVFYKAPYTLSREGIYMGSAGLVPWSSIEKVTYTDSISYYRGFQFHSYSASLDLRDFSFLKTAAISPRAKHRIEKKRSVKVFLDDETEKIVLDSWISAYCRNLKRTKDISKTLWSKEEREYSPEYTSPYRKNNNERRETARFTLCGIPVFDSDNLLTEYPQDLVIQMNAIVEQIVNVLAREDYEALRPIFFDHTHVEPDGIRLEIEKAKADGRLKCISPYDKNARAKIVVTSAKFFRYYYDLRYSGSAFSMSLFLLFRIGRDSGELQVLWPGAAALLGCESFTDG